MEFTLSNFQPSVLSIKPHQNFQWDISRHYPIACGRYNIRLKKKKKRPFSEVTEISFIDFLFVQLMLYLGLKLPMGFWMAGLFHFK